MFADSVFTSTCTAYGVETVVGTIVCFIPNPLFSHRIQLALPVAGFTSYRSEYPYCSGNRSYRRSGNACSRESRFGPTSAKTRVALDETLTTAGPTHQGYKNIFAEGGSYQGDGFSTQLSGGPLNELFVETVPFMLHLLLLYHGGAEWESSPNNGVGFASGSAVFKYKFTELWMSCYPPLSQRPGPCLVCRLARDL